MFLFSSIAAFPQINWDLVNKEKDPYASPTPEPTLTPRPPPIPTARPITLPSPRPPPVPSTTPAPVVSPTPIRKVLPNPTPIKNSVPVIKATPTPIQSLSTPPKVNSSSSSEDSSLSMAIPKTSSKSHWRSSWIFGAMSWEESLKLTGPLSSNLTANIYALTAGWARAYRTPGFEWTTGIRGIYGFADIGSQSTNSTYFQKNVPVYGATASSGPMLVTKTSRAGVGLSLLGFYRSAPWQSPAAGYSINKESLFAFGVGLDARWIFGTWCLEQNIAFLPNLQSALWQLQIEL